MEELSPSECAALLDEHHQTMQHPECATSEAKDSVIDGNTGAAREAPHATTDQSPNIATPSSNDRSDFSGVSQQARKADRQTRELAEDRSDLKHKVDNSIQLQEVISPSAAPFADSGLVASQNRSQWQSTSLVDSDSASRSTQVSTAVFAAIAAAEGRSKVS